MNRYSQFRVEKIETFAPTNSVLKGVAEKLINSADSDKSLYDRLLYLSRQKPSSKSEFEIVPSRESKEGFDVVAKKGSLSTPIFTIAVGTTSVVYVNKFTFTDRMIYKAKLSSEITSVDELSKVIENFINVEPKESEVIDISKETLEKKMNERKEVHVDFSGFTRLKR